MTEGTSRSVGRKSRSTSIEGCNWERHRRGVVQHTSWTTDDDRGGGGVKSIPI